MGMAVVTKSPAAEEFRVGLMAKEARRSLKMTLDAETIVVGDQELVIRRAVGGMATATAFFGSQMLEDEGTLEFRMTLITTRVLAV